VAVIHRRWWFRGCGQEEESPTRETERERERERDRDEVTRTIVPSRHTGGHTGMRVMHTRYTA